MPAGEREPAPSEVTAEVAEGLLGNWEVSVVGIEGQFGEGISIAGTHR